MIISTITNLKLPDNDKPKSFLFPVWSLSVVVLIYTFFVLMIAATITSDDESLGLLGFIACIPVLLLFEVIFYWRIRRSVYPKKWASAHVWLIIIGCVILPVFQDTALIPQFAKIFLGKQSSGVNA